VGRPASLAGCGDRSRQYARSVLVEELDAALDELPKEQREVFIGHEARGVQLQRTGCANAV